jgi:hypothetical protein
VIDLRFMRRGPNRLNYPLETGHVVNTNKSKSLKYLATKTILSLLMTIIDEEISHL